MKQTTTIITILTITLLLLITSCTNTATTDTTATTEPTANNQALPPLEGTPTSEPNNGDLDPLDHNLASDAPSTEPTTQVATDTTQATATQNTIDLSNDYIILTTESNNQFQTTIDPLQTEASVPDALTLTENIANYNKGTILTIFVDAQDFQTNGQGSEQLSIISSSNNAESWSEKHTINIEGAEGHIPVDPSIIQESDGTLVLYYFDFTAMQNQGLLEQGLIDELNYEIYRAESTDAVNFKVTNLAYQSTTAITDPDVILFNDNYYMYLATNDGIIVASSNSNEETFTYNSNTNVEGIPGSIIQDNKVHLYGCNPNGIIIAQSEDALTFGSQETRTESSLSHSCDPAPFTLEDNTKALIIKKS